MTIPIYSGQDGVKEGTKKLFEEEKSLVFTGLIGLFLAAIIAVFISFNGAAVSPEGNLKHAFSFNAAVGIYILSIAAILPFSTLNNRRRKRFRKLLIGSSFYSYTIETVQHFRGFNPRFSTKGSAADIIAGISFGVVSIILVTLSLWLTIHFFKKIHTERPLLLMGIRYALLSVMIAMAAGIWMSTLQSRYTGDSGNVMTLHGLGFHALQTLLLTGWLLEKAKVNEKTARLLLHAGSISWILSILLIGIQTALGKTVFELSLLPSFIIFLLFIWFVIAALSGWFYLKNKC
ncbi:hypothetical protein [Domibacillus epiphyticus]|uniref:DUF998 domain-containing protein n=1 Tax=Domibacillus epiphyticus TaxID=1714355 RepID=A0A1V2ABQ6_9BACI|nr:hypothetical protein [Domibacillus epiphyticus]OMP68426.1 hypothetical protein BTO28_02055 [Domibacillus epiphyticus]